MACRRNNGQLYPVPGAQSKVARACARAGPGLATPLSTETTASPEVCYDLLEALNKGENAYSQFQHQRLECSQKGFFERLPRLNLKTFDKMKCRVTRKSSNKEIVLKNELFGHLLLVASSRKLDMKIVLEHPSWTRSMGFSQ